MKQEISEALRREFPIISDSVALEVGDGWCELIRELCSKLMEHAPGVHLTMCKQKYGTLRVDTDEYNEVIGEILQAIEDKSQTICENCGSEGAERTPVRSWIYSFCPVCYVTLAV